ncbi:hypothetical protein [Flavobacterium laiguense]|uniref:DUF1834 domain-containing protein n=1 Tax=Flavobacterium laiguense TaxID=2169409 RepID=A0A2U1K1W3_9FLAO|nr:hypothetical protein [Flavobacterium laiguense]PWA10958.1 hypothetical protein DB891_03765 [Flavobacterium laiguense]
MKDLKNLYLEHEKRISDNIAEIKHVDLWSEQVSFMADEHPFRSPAVFFGYRVLATEDQGEKIQELRLQVDVYLFYETFADTSKGSKKQQKALDFLDLLTKINSCFHATSGNYYSNMRRTGFNPVETGGAGILYVQRYELTMTDDSAKELYELMKFEHMEMEVIREEVPAVGNQSNLYVDIEV